MFSGRFSHAPHVPRPTAFRDSPALIRNPVEVFERYRKEYGPTFTMHLGGAKRAVVSTDPDFIEHALQTNRDNYRMSDIRVKRMAEFQGKGLLNSHGEAWLRKRRFLSQGFKHERLAALVPIQANVLDEILNGLEGEIATGPIDVYQLTTDVTLKLVGKSIFGSRMSDAEIEQIGTAIKTIQSFVVRQIVRPYMIPWYRVSGQSRRFQRIRREGDQIARDYIAGRIREGGGEGGDMLELLLQEPWEPSGARMSAEQILIESMQLLVAGNETSAATLAWTLYLLAGHPEIVHEMRQEAERALGSGSPSLGALHELDLTRRVIEEGMRLYPSFWMIDRLAIQEDEIQGIRIPPGTMVIPYIYGTHRNPNVWDEPEVFDPGRFTKEARRERHAFAYLPFGGGPRKCIGANLGVVQMLLILATIIRKYDPVWMGPGEAEIAPMMVLHPKGRLSMQLRRAA